MQGEHIANLGKQTKSGVQQYPGLDGLRGVAALIVLATHSSNANMHLLPGINLTGMGRMGLWLFFVLSAFLLTEQALKATKSVSYVRWSLKYILRRFFRIYPLLIVAIVVDLALGRITGGEAGYTLALVQGAGIFWTIPPEFQYYFFIPAIGLILSMPILPAFASCILLIVASFMVKVELALWPYFMLFVTSSMLARIWVASPAIAITIARLWPATIIAFILMIPLVMGYWLPIFDPHAQTSLDWRLVGEQAFIWVPRNFSYVYGLVFAPILFACLIEMRGVRFLSSSPMRYLGKVSFGLYLLHPVVIAGLEHSGFMHTKIGGLVVFAASMAIAATVHHLIEEPTRKIGYKLSHRWSGG